MGKNTISAFAAATSSSSNKIIQHAPYNEPEPPERLLRRPEVCHLTSLPSSSLTDLINKGSFPAPYKLSERMSAWKMSEVQGWINSRSRAV